MPATHPPRGVLHGGQIKMHHAEYKWHEVPRATIYLAAPSGNSFDPFDPTATVLQVRHSRTPIPMESFPTANAMPPIPRCPPCPPPPRPTPNSPPASTVASSSTSRPAAPKKIPPSPTRSPARKIRQSSPL